MLMDLGLPTVRATGSVTATSAFMFLPGARVIPAGRRPPRTMARTTLATNVGPRARYRGKAAAWYVAEDRSLPERLRLLIQEGARRGRYPRDGVRSPAWQVGARPDSGGDPGSPLILTRDSEPTSRVKRLKKRHRDQWHGIELGATRLALPDGVGPLTAGAVHRPGLLCRPPDAAACRDVHVPQPSQ